MTTITPSPRVKIWTLRVMLATTLAACVYAGGCEAPRNESLTLGDGPLVASGGNATTSSDAIFESPEVIELVAAYGRESFPEYSRLDGRMNIDNPAARTATAEWPQYPAPDMTSVRYVYLPVRTSSSSMIIPVFRRERPYWHGRSY